MVFNDWYIDEYIFGLPEKGNNFSVKKLFYYKVHNLYYLINGGIIQCFIVQL